MDRLISINCLIYTIPHAKENWFFTRCRTLRFLPQTHDMCNSRHRSGHVPRKSKERADKDTDHYHKQVKMIPTAFLQIHVNETQFTVQSSNNVIVMFVLKSGSDYFTTWLVAATGGILLSSRLMYCTRVDSRFIYYKSTSIYSFKIKRNYQLVCY